MFRNRRIRPILHVPRIIHDLREPGLGNGGFEVGHFEKTEVLDDHVDDDLVVGAIFRTWKYGAHQEGYAVGLAGDGIGVDGVAPEVDYRGPVDAVEVELAVVGDCGVGD